jgi:hypothetical protein
MKTKKTKPKTPKRKKPIKQKRKKPIKQKVAGYWVHRKAVDKWHAPVSYYVEPYKRKKTKPISKRRRAILKKARHVEAEVKNPLLPGWVRYDTLAENPNAEEEPKDLRIRYTYKVEILVKADYKYAMHFAPKSSMPLNDDTVALQYWHSKFEPSIKAATLDFLQRVPEIRAYGDVQFISIDLYQVSGFGPLTKKYWKLLRSFDEPEDVQ